MEYLKKRKLTSLVKQIIGCNEKDKVVVTKYDFYRGTEFLDFHMDGKYYHVCSMAGGAYLSLESWSYDDDYNKVNYEHKNVNGCEYMQLDVAV